MVTLLHSKIQKTLMAEINQLLEQAIKSNSWAFKEALDILKRLDNKLPEKGFVLFETGYGPSGFPHIGTFGEVARTAMVKHAFETISDMPTKLLCISDDMDGMRKIPDTIPNKEEYEKYMDLPLTSIPDPFGTHESFGHHMNARLRGFLDKFGFEYEFLSSTECYKKGFFNEMLLKVLEHYNDIMNIMLSTLREERRATYSPFMPVCLDTGKVLQVPIIEQNVEKGTIVYKNADGKRIESKVTDGACKLQWKPDFGMRWAAFDVDFEMYGKDHLVNGEIYTKICRTIGGKAPKQMFYELFLDEKGQKISKSKGNGLTIEEWLRYAPKESLTLFMYQSPRKAKKLCFDVIPKSMDEYISHLSKYYSQTDKQFDNPVYHIHSGNPSKIEETISYSLILNLVSACNTDDSKVIWGYVQNSIPNATPENSPFIDAMIKGAMNYYKDFIEPNKSYRTATTEEVEAMNELAVELENTHQEATSEEIQSIVYRIGKEHNFELRNWFKGLYEILLGSSQGPRIGSFVKLYGIQKSVELIQSKKTSLKG